MLLNAPSLNDDTINQDMFWFNVGGTLFNISKTNLGNIQGSLLNIKAENLLTNLETNQKGKCF